MLSVLAALGAAAAFGVAAVLQAIATERTHDRGGLDPRLLVRLLREPAFLGSLALNGFGFLLHVAALQSLPLFLVQAFIASSVAVTAVLSVRVFDSRLSPRQWAAVVTVVAGLALLAPTASSHELDRTGGHWAVLLGGVVLITALAVGAGRVRGAPGAVLLGLLAGSAFGLVAVCARLLPDLAPAVLVGEPVAYVLALSGGVAFLLYSTAMQRGSVTTATAAMVITQTGLPAVVGVVLLGDAVRPGFLPLALAGFALALSGALALARFEHLDLVVADPATAPGHAR